MKKLVLVFGLMFGIASTYAQTEEELKAEQAPKTAEIAKLQAEVDALQAKIDALPGWKIGAFGTIGANLQGFNNWYTNASPNSSTGSIGVSGSYLAIGNASGLRFDDSLNRILPFNTETPTATNGTLDIGSAGARFKDLYLAGGVT